MDEDISIINTNSRNEKIKNFFIKNKKLLITSILLIIIIVLSFYSFQIYKKAQREKISEKFNSAVIEFKNGDKSEILNSMKKIIEDKDSSYSPLALYFLIDNNLISNSEEANKLFDILINKTALENEIKNLIIYKKALFNADQIVESELLDTLKPIINSKSIWKSHALYLLGEYFYSKNENQKAKEFFNQVVIAENANQDLIKEAQKRLIRDLSE